jgi:hypothetical protein
MVALMMQSDVQREKDAPPGHEVGVLLVFLDEGRWGGPWGRGNVDDDHLHGRTAARKGPREDTASAGGAVA